MSGEQKPVAWSYELATRLTEDGSYRGWERHLTFYKPCVPEGSIRNLTPLGPMDGGSDGTQQPE